MEWNELNKFPFTICCTILGKRYVIHPTNASANGLWDIFFLSRSFSLSGFRSPQAVLYFLHLLRVRTAVNLRISIKCKPP